MHRSDSEAVLVYLQLPIVRLSIVGYGSAASSRPMGVSLALWQGDMVFEVRCFHLEIIPY